MNRRTSRGAEVGDHPSRVGPKQNQDVFWLEVTMREAEAVEVQHSIQQSTEKPGQYQPEVCRYTMQHPIMFEQSRVILFRV